MTNTNNRKICIFFLFLILYIYIYNPVFRLLHVSFLKPMLLVSFIYLYLKKRFCILTQYIKIETFFFYILFLFALITGGILGHGNISFAYKHIQAFLETVFIGFVLSDIIRYLKIDILKIIVILGFVASIITIYFLLHPSQSVYLRTNVITDSLVDIGYDAKIHMFRSFGIAEGLTSIYGVVQGFIAALCLLNLKKSYYYLIPVPFLVLSAFVNARTGVLVFLVSIPFFIFSLHKHWKAIIGIIILIIICVFTISIINTDEISRTFEWGLSLFEDIGNLLSGQKTGNFSYLFGDMLFVPDRNINFLFGTGEIAHNNAGNGSDISFVNQLFIGGFFYMLTITLFCFYVSFLSKKITKSISFSFLVLGSLLLMDFKGMDPSFPNGLVRLIFLYLFSSNNNIEETHYVKRTSYFFRYALS